MVEEPPSEFMTNRGHFTPADSKSPVSVERYFVIRGARTAFTTVVLVLSYSLYWLSTSLDRLMWPLNLALRRRRRTSLSCAGFAYELRKQTATDWKPPFDILERTDPACLRWMGSSSLPLAETLQRMVKRSLLSTRGVGRLVPKS